MWTQSQISMLLGLFGRYNAFPSNGKEDEFVITREDGRRQGIFKEWAPPILPFLSGHGVDEWREKASQQPAFLEKELRRAWRNSWLIDRDLAAKFSAASLPESLEQQVVELVNRLMQAFGLMAPFYHLEAIVDDLAWLGIDASKAIPSTGGLDVAAFLLPSALQQYVVASAGNWNGLSWPKVYNFTALALANPLHAGALLGLAGLLGVPPRHLIFAANALQWIPARVGGKREDVEERTAIEGLKEIIQKGREAKNLDCIAVLADVNARIRFFNWLPLIEGPENFRGRNWTYASVCDTADALLAVLDAHPELWQPDFRDIYTGKLRPQVSNLDAASAKGRFLLDLIVNEKKLAFEFASKTRPYHYKRSNWLVPNATHELSQPCLVGTKPTGLALASYVLGREHVLPGLVASMDSTETRRYKHFADVARVQWPEVKLWVVRSSSIDEGTARGVYETILRVPRAKLETAIKKCVQSYNRKSAVAFRRAKGLSEQSHRIEIAVLLQPYQTGTFGGVATVDSSDKKSRQYQISVARTAQQVTSGGKTREYEFSDGAQAPNKLIPLVSILERLHDVFGGALQVEWLIDRAGRVVILQMEFMPIKAPDNVAAWENDEQIAEVSVNSLADIRHAEAQESSNALRFVIGPGPDSMLFQGELFTLVVRLGQRIKEISLAKPVSPSSHFANICRHFGIKLIQPL